MSQADELLQRADDLITRLESALSREPKTVDWNHIAFRWTKDQGLVGIKRPHKINYDNLLCIEDQKFEVALNTSHFLAGRPANHVLLTGARGTGKSSLIKATLSAFSDQHLRMIEVDMHDLIGLAQIIDAIDGRHEKFIVYCDDLSFEADDASYKALKSVLDGSLSSPPDNMLIYASSNRRHLLAESMQDNRNIYEAQQELHQNEAVEEKISLSERFGLWLTFQPLNQDQYLAIAYHSLKCLGCHEVYNNPVLDKAAIRWALKRGSLSGRVASQFAKDWIGKINDMESKP